MRLWASGSRLSDFARLAVSEPFFLRFQWRTDVPPFGAVAADSYGGTPSGVPHNVVLRPPDMTLPPPRRASLPVPPFLSACEHFKIFAEVRYGDQSTTGREPWFPSRGGGPAGRSSDR